MWAKKWEKMFNILKSVRMVARLIQRLKLMPFENFVHNPALNKYTNFLNAGTPNAYLRLAQIEN